MPQDLIATFFDNVSATPEQYLAGQSLDRGAGDFTRLRDTPLLALPDGFYPLDITFLVDKFESSPFWNIARSLEEQTKKRFFSFWGGLFETYVRNIIVESVDGRLNRVIPFSIFEDNGEEFCDLAIICGRALIVIEIKGTTLTAAPKYSGSLKAVKKEIDKKFVESADRTQATKQLSRNILQAFNIPGRKVAGMPSDIVQVFPVIVTLDEIGGTVGVNAYLGDYFKNLLGKFRSSVAICPLICMSASNLEDLCGFLKSVRCSDVLSAHIAAHRRTPQKRLVNPLSFAENAAIKDAQVTGPTVNQKRWHGIVQKMIVELGLSPDEPKVMPTIAS